MKRSYTVPMLHRLGGVAEMTGTDFPCVDINGDGNGKTFGLPSDVNFTFFGLPIPISDCVTGS